MPKIIVDEIIAFTDVAINKCVYVKLLPGRNISRDFLSNPSII